MDVAATLAAMRHSQTAVLTVSVDSVDLRNSVQVGRALRIYARPVHSTERGLSVVVEVVSDGILVMNAFMTFVSVDKAGQIGPVRPVELENAQDESLFKICEVWRELRKKLLAGTVPQLPERLTQQVPEGSWAKAAYHMRQFPGTFARNVLRLRNHEAARRRRDSYIHVVEPVRAHEVNFQGVLQDGTVTRWLGRSAERSARKWLDNEPVRLVGVHGLTYLRPSQPNDCVHVHSIIVHTDGQSVTALVEVYAEDPVSRTALQTVRAFMSYEPFRTCVIPPIECVDEAERELHTEVLQRLELQRVPLRAGWSESS